VPPRQLQPRLARDLETICLKCMRKDPARRYANAAALADDLHRFQVGEPIKARPVGLTERAVRWVRRNKLVSALTAPLVVVLTAGLVASSLFGLDARSEARRADTKTTEAQSEARAARKAEGDAQREARAARQREYVANMVLAQNSWEQNQVHRLVQVL